MTPDKNNKQVRPESYPKPTETDTQLNHQPEYSEPYANRIDDQENVSAELQQAQERMKKTKDATDE